jgi:hypothetical protein
LAQHPVPAARLGRSQQPGRAQWVNAAVHPRQLFQALDGANLVGHRVSEAQRLA